LALPRQLRRTADSLLANDPTGRTYILAAGSRDREVLAEASAALLTRRIGAKPYLRVGSEILPSRSPETGNNPRDGIGARCLEDPVEFYTRRCHRLLGIRVVIGQNVSELCRQYLRVRSAVCRHLHRLKSRNVTVCERDIEFQHHESSGQEDADHTHDDEQCPRQTVRVAVVHKFIGSLCQEA